MPTIEQKLDDAIASQNALTQMIANKKGEIDAAVAAQLAAFNDWKNSARSEFPVMNVHSNNLLWSGAATGVESGGVAVRGTVPSGFYAWIANTESVINGLRDFVAGENSLTLPSYCPTPKVLKVKYIPRPNTTSDNGGQSYVPIPFSWGYPAPVAGAVITQAFYARVASGVATLGVSNGQTLNGQWQKIVARTTGNEPMRAYWNPVVSIPSTLELEFMLPHIYLGFISDASLPVYARPVSII
jgi:hypothetical protein